MEGTVGDAVTAGAVGSTTLPLGDRGETWDAGAAVGAMTTAAQLRKFHFWQDPDSDPASKSSYKLPFGSPDSSDHAVWAGITAAAQRLSQTQGIDKAAVQRRIAVYYRKAARQYNDDSISPPWEAAPMNTVMLDAEIEAAHAWLQGARTGAAEATDTTGFLFNPEPPAPDAEMGAAWEALVWIEGQQTRDSGLRRIIGTGETRWREGPYTLMTQDQNPESGGHAGAYVSGRVDEFSREGMIVRARGRFNTDENGQKAEAYVRNQSMTNVSGDFSYDSLMVEMQMGTMEIEAGEEADKLLIEESSEDTTITFKGVELTALTHVNVGAFGDAKIALTADGKPQPRVVGYIQLVEDDRPPLSLIAAGIARMDASELAALTSALDKAIITGLISEEQAAEAFRARVEGR